MDSHSVAPTLGRRFLVVALLVAVVPLALVGAWATRGAARSGRELLRAQLESQVGQLARDVAREWGRWRGDLLMLGENEPVRLLLLDSSGTGPLQAPAFVEQAFRGMPALDEVTIRDRADVVRVRLERAPIAMGLERSAAPSERGGAIAVRLPLTDLLSGDTVGTLDAVIRLVALVPATARPPAKEGPLLAVASGGSIVPPSGVDARLFTDEETQWDGERWTSVRRTIPEPSMTLLLAAPRAPYERPFERSAQRSAVAVLGAATLVGIAVVLLTRRLTRDVERELAQREALAAVGEFASELAHEVRNPLTAIRLDLQRAQEAMPGPERSASILPRVLAQVDRLDRAVTGALRVARGGTVERHPVDVRSVVEAARLAAEPEFVRRGARTVVTNWPGVVPPLRGDAGALEQLFLNILVNAAQALAPGGEARIAATRRDHSVEIVVSDDGAGMTPAQLEAAKRPFRSTRRDGTGLGLKIARRIAENHGGALEVRSRAGEGTEVVVRLAVTG